MTPCFSQATTLPASFADDIAAVGAAGGTSVEAWLTKLETHLDSASVEQTRELLAMQGIALAAASYQGGLLLSEGEARSEAFALFRRRLELCQTFAIPVMVLAADYAAKVEVAALGKAVASLREAARWAEGFGVQLALEFRGDRAICTNLETAALLVGECSEANAGICLDVFHYHKGPSKPEDLELLTAANLFHVQLCDVAGVPRETMTDADRVFPDEGSFHLSPILDRLRIIGYAGAVSMELMNPVLWKAKPTQVAELGLTALRRCLTLDVSSQIPRPR